MSSPDPQRPREPMSAKMWFYGFIAVMIVGGGVLFMQSKPSTSTTHLEVYAPKLEGLEVKGFELFHAKCASCHGENTAGSEKGPPFVHKVYESTHHVDASFYNAVKRGVQAHHWPYGNMPAIKGVSDDQIAAIVAYVRKVQKENGVK
jgi:mono/diheme cytochrome c family protein